jgi:hypothetical protein
VAGDQVGAKVEGTRGAHAIGAERSLRALPAEQANERVEVFGEQIFAAQVTDDALFLLTVVAVGFH